MAFNSFNSFSSADQLGMAGDFEPDDILDDFDDAEYHTHHSEKIKKEAPSQTQLELERIQQRNRELESQLQADRVNSARQLGEMSTKMDFLMQGMKQRPAEINSSTEADEFVGFWGKQNAGEQGQGQTQQAPPQVDVNQLVDSRLRQISSEAASAKAEEEALANRFRTEHPDLLYLGKEAYHEWEKLKSLRPDLPQTTRYELMKREVQRRHQELGGRKGQQMRGSQIPPSQSGGEEVVNMEIRNAIAQNPRSERERLHRKAKDTALRVKEFRKDQLHRTSLTGG